MKRLPPISGEWIDRHQPVSFTFEGESISGYHGDTVSSALWAAGRRVLGRSFKYHRPRGILSLANHDVNTLMQDGPKLNLRADVVPVESGMDLTAIHTFGGVQGDRASVLDRLSRFLPVGFYYKAFLDKNQFPFWERVIRSITGLGAVDTTTPRLRTPKRYDFCDVLVIGSGVSGLTAAIAAAEAGADVVVVDENAHAGGSGHYQRGDDGERSRQTAALVAQVQQHPRIRLYTDTVAAGYYADHWVPLVHRDYIAKMRAQAVIVAAGAYEQPAVFRNNDLPGVMLASAAQRLIYRYAVQPMERAVVLTSNSDGYRAALDLAAQGVTVVAVVEMRSQPVVTDPVRAVQARGIQIFSQSCLYEARPNPGGDGVASVVVCPLDTNGQPQTGFTQTLACDGVVMSVGWAPTANLLYQAGVTMRFDATVQQFVPDRLPAGIFACGRVNGVYDWEDKQRDGQWAGLAAAHRLGLVNTAPSLEKAIAPECPSHPYPMIAHPKGKNFVDFDEDLHYDDFIHAVQEGFDNIELLKRYTTVGMGPSQGKHSNMNALRILAHLRQLPPDAIGTTTARPMFHPVPMAHLAGRGFMPERRSPLHSRHAQQGAVWMPAGQWQRPAYYHRPGLTREACIQQEVMAVRTRVGLIDVGTLGKLELRGPDAMAFLERIYTGKFAKMKVGSSRYALMVDESGVVIDDGVVARLAADHVYFTTTTSGSARIYRELSRLITMWQMDCGIVNLTGARAAVNLAGPRSLSLLQTLTDIDLSPDAFPYLAVRQGAIAGIPALLMRVGFVGEWGYELHVPADQGQALWDALITAGKHLGIRPFGVEAQRLLRLEKGHVIVGQDTDGLTTPYDANLGWAVKMDKPFFIGQRSLQILKQRSPKQILAGFTLPERFQGRPPQECHLVIHNGDIAGRVTSIGYSSSLKRYLGLAYLQPELTAIGTEITIRLTDGSMVTATVAPTPFYDPDNHRQAALSREEAFV
ncbi:2Fe-2S iron-sulfur cluster-binding protein [Leptolyngbya sp. CCY15150]|uniref:2Fe-2S iron-sulfur cluster-binding protein n=1 Tax=Leptolyngbya sp. CCY15150 TaxID=2767772 RepID=UPI0019511FDA|nr:2Fe-2S iron-sulfur cluster-binding protein [Leptolyngbya sp. CCY15150]